MASARKPLPLPPASDALPVAPKSRLSFRAPSSKTSPLTEPTTDGQSQYDAEGGISESQNDGSRGSSVT